MNQGRDEDPAFTSEDLFGDLVDSKEPAQQRPSPGARAKRSHAGPIKVKVSEPGVRARGEASTQDLSGLVDAFDEASASRPAPRLRTPTPVAIEPLPDLPELKESERLSRDEARSDFLKLTSKLPRARPDASHGTELEVDLAGVAEDAIQAATPQGVKGADAVLPLPDEPPGLAYGPYRLIEKIATGGMAEVFKAQRSGVAGFEKVVAVKRILPHLSYNNEFVEMFVAEAKLVAGLHHPNIVAIFDLGKIGSSYYIAMEYVNGVDLRSILRKLRERTLRMPIDLAIHLVSSVAAGLDHAHQSKDDEGRPLKIVHRDVSPQNILISWDGAVKLTDFGIAKAATKASTTEKGALRGKLMYMSPEQASSRPVDHRSDVFALGIVLYELVTDQRPFFGSTDMSLLDKVRRGTVAPPSSLHADIPAHLEKLVMKALEREPQDRHRDAGAMHHELEQMLQEAKEPVGARDLSRFVRILFDRNERADDTRGMPASDSSEPELEVDLGILDDPGPAEPMRILSDTMPAERLLKRFQ